MKIYVEYEEPFAIIDGKTLLQIVRIAKEDVIKWQRHCEPRYRTDEQALEDFLCVHRGHLVEEKEA